MNIKRDLELNFAAYGVLSFVISWLCVAHVELGWFSKDFVVWLIACWIIALPIMIAIDIVRWSICKATK